VLQLAEIPTSHLVPPGKQGNRAATGEHGEWRGGIVPQVKPLLPPPLHRFGHGNVKIRIDYMPKLDMNNHAPRNC
jgi:hypothetical protein